ncbi:MAG: hypothetical protein GXO90_08985, partial [FCB group bacterium]|nr:hypothetical protein [FCB group bacterium]
ACPDNPPTHHRDSTIHLSVVNEGTFSVRLKVSVEDSSDVWTFRLNRDDSTVAVISSLRADTTVRDGGLLPGHTYRYRAYWLDGGIATDSSEEVTATTMDTTSHNFIWEIDTLGNYGSYLNDVAIVDENNIWVVGYITTDTATYNAAHWNGSEWEMIAIQPQGYILPIQCIYYYNEEDIWFGQSGLPIQWNGHEYYLYTPANSTHPGQPTINAIWGSSPDDIYFVGDGSIVHYDGSVFRRMESGTEVDLIDISGTTDSEHIFAVGKELSGESTVLEYHDGLWTVLYYSQEYYPHVSLYGQVGCVSVYGDTAYIVTKNGLWKFNYQTRSSKLVSRYDSMLITQDYKSIIVQNPNDIAMEGAGFRLIHFNGVNYWYDHTIDTLYEHLYQISGDFKDNLVVIVGNYNWAQGGLIVRGYR